LIALISDIHANLEALEAVLDALGGARDIYCAGDIVGYGPNPNECCEILRQRNIRATLGNHDIVCANFGHLDADDHTLDDRTRELTLACLNDMNEIARASAEWTYGILTQQNRQYLRNLPLELREKKLTMVHGSIGADYDRLTTYLDQKFEAFISQKGTRDLTISEFYSQLVRQVQTPILIVGHTHVPSKEYVFNRSLFHRFLPVLCRERWVVNPGSVGQPRRGREATFALIKLATCPYLGIGASLHLFLYDVKLCTVPYERARTIGKIQGEERLSETVRFMLAKWL